MRFPLRRLAAVIAISAAFASLTSPATGQARVAPRFCSQTTAYCLRMPPKVRPRRPIDPIYVVAARHHWDTAEIHCWLAVLYRESTSTLGHYNLTAVNGYYYGVGQLGGGPAAYYRYGGNPSTPLGQLTAMAAYIVQHGYGRPSEAWYSEESRGFY